MPKDPNGASKDLQRTQKSPKMVEKLLNEPSNLQNLSRARYVAQKALPFQNISNFPELSTNGLWVGG